MRTLEKLAIEHIRELSSDAQDIVVRNHEDMGIFAMRDSGFGKLGEKLSEIERWSDAILKDCNIS